MPMHFEDAGTYWCAHWDHGLGAADLAVPSPPRSDANGWSTCGQLIVLGVSYTVESGGAGRGITLLSSGDDLRVVWRCLPGASVTVSGAIVTVWGVQRDVRIGAGADLWVVPPVEFA